MSKVSEYFKKIVVLSSLVVLPLMAGNPQDNTDQSSGAPAPFEDQGEIARGGHGGGGGHGSGGGHGGWHGGGGGGHHGWDGGGGHHGWHGGDGNWGHHGNWNNNYWYGGWGGVGIYPYYDGYSSGYDYYPQQNYYYNDSTPSNGSIYYYDTGTGTQYYDNGTGGYYYGQ